jgi:hypothetical protein
MMPGGPLPSALFRPDVEIGMQKDPWLTAGDAAVRLAWKLLWSWRRARPPLGDASPGQALATSQQTPVSR